MRWPTIAAVAHFTASPEHIERLLDPRGETVAELVVRLDDGTGQVFLDFEGRLCVVEGERPQFYKRMEVSGALLATMLDHYGVNTHELTFFAAE